MCYTKSVQNIAENETIDSFYLSTIDDSQDGKSWTTQITVNQVDLYFKLDTGVEVTAICLQPDAKPFSLGTARNISLPLRDKVQETLNQMEAQSVISKVRQSTPWCAGMVVEIKKSGGVRICVDLKPLNKWVLRECHPCQESMIR